MKRFQIHLVLTFTASILGAQSQKNLAEPLKLEWKSELVVPNGDFERMTDIVRIENSWIFAVATDKGSAVYKISEGLKPSYSYTLPNYLTHIHARNQDYFTKEHCNIKRRSFSNEVLESSCFMMQPDWPAGSSVSAFTDRCLYHAEGDSFLKFDLEGNLIFRKKIGDLVNTQMIAQGGVFVYVFSQINKPSQGPSLMQYDTLGNQKWSVPIGLLVYGMYADDDGNCYMLTSETGGIGHVQKYNKEGELVYDVKLPGQRGSNAYKLGDSLFVCGQVSGAVRVEGQKTAAFCILSAKTGEVYHQQTIDLDPDPSHLEDFTQIVSDGANVYVGGYFGGQGKTNVLIKYSREGNTTGLNDERSPRGFNIFPNPGGSKFTITCENNKTKTLKVTVRNLAGQVILDKDIPCNTDGGYTLDLGKHPAGNYTVEITNGNDISVKKIVVE